jgi:flagellar basal-body rod protein FlgC
MDLIKSMLISAPGLRAQSSRMRVISENLANADSMGSSPGADPYRRKTMTFRNVLDRSLGVEKVVPGQVLRDKSEFATRFDPGHPAADKNGYVKMPNVNMMIEMSDMREAQRSYEANLSAIESARGMLNRLLDLLR